MINYQEACEIAENKLKICFEQYDKITVTEINEGWVFLFGKEGMELTGQPSWLITKNSGEIKCFNIPPISNLKKIHAGKRIEYKNKAS